MLDWKLVSILLSSATVPHHVSFPERKSYLFIKFRSDGANDNFPLN